MIPGRTSNFTEGFQSFTVDDDLMLANLKQALEYSKENLSIPDSRSKLNLPSTTKPNTTIPNTTIPNITSSNLKSSKNNSNTNNISEEPKLMEQLPPKPTLANLNSIPTKEMNNTKTKSNSKSNSNMNTVEAKNTKNKNTSMSNEEKFKDIKMIKNEIENGETLAELDEEVYANKFKKKTNNVNKYNNKMNTNMTDDMDDNIDNDMDVDMDADMDDDMDKDMSEDEFSEGFENKLNNRKKDKIYEGFQGSSELESRYLKNILLSLLLTAIGYLVVHSFLSNLIPLNDISPQLNKFKKLVYGGLFFLIAYLCLEIF